jgi:glycosyltransferase involved in cell wall biosynthesis
MSLTIYILCYNRPDSAKLSILSVLAQSCQNFKLIVSDHSSNDSVRDMVREAFQNISYVRRSHKLKHLEHFNLCMDEVETDYYCLFHDDDTMHKDFVKNIFECIWKFPVAMAYASNAYIETNGNIERRTAFLSRNKYELIESPQVLAAKYFSRHQSGIAPNPSYIYSRHMVGGIRFIVDGGKYADVALLLDMLQVASIIWINKPLMTYRIHGNNLGGIESIPDRLRFLGYLKKNKEIFSGALIQDYRRSFIYKNVVDRLDNSRSRRKRVLQSFLNYYYLYHYTRFGTYKALLLRAIVKWDIKIDLR